MKDGAPTEEVAAIIRNRLGELGRSQGWLGAEIAAVSGRESPFRQTTVSQWMVGEAAWQPHILFTCERVLGLRPGDLSRHLGYLPLNAAPSPTTVEGAVNVDPKLSAPLKRALVAAYREMVGAG